MVRRAAPGFVRKPDREAIAKIYGGNLLRLMRAVEAAAGR
jgi:hypothetical protein